MRVHTLKAWNCPAMMPLCPTLPTFLLRISVIAAFLCQHKLSVTQKEPINMPKQNNKNKKNNNKKGKRKYLCLHTCTSTLAAGTGGRTFTQRAIVCFVLVN